jgi:hypothetical protein
LNLYTFLYLKAYNRPSGPENKTIHFMKYLIVLFDSYEKWPMLNITSQIYSSWIFFYTFYHYEFVMNLHDFHTMVYQYRGDFKTISLSSFQQGPVLLNTLGSHCTHYILTS